MSRSYLVLLICHKTTVKNHVGEAHSTSASMKGACENAPVGVMLGNVALLLLHFYLGMHRYHFFTNRYEYEYFYSCTCRCRYRVPILLRFGLHESAINLEADFILSSADYVKPIVQN